MQITVTLWPRVMRDLDHLRRQGLFGITAEEVARYLITRQIQDLVQTKFLPLEYPGAEPAPSIEQPPPVENGDWLTDMRLETIRAALAAGKRWKTALDMLGLPREHAPSVAKFKARLKRMGLRYVLSDKALARTRLSVVAMRAKNPRVRRAVPEPVTPVSTLADVVIPRVLPPPPPPPPVLTTPPAARQAVAGIVRAANAPVSATRESIQRWGETRGIITGKLDLDRVNKKRRELGLAPFEIEEFQRPGRA